MHDPLMVAFQVRLPRLVPDRGSYRPRTRSFITVWHRDPSGYDSTTCRPSDVWWHAGHWRFQVHPWQDWRRRYLDRCAWCGGRSTKADPVNVSHRWNAPRYRWWQGHTHCFHRECSAISSAHKRCTCGPGPDSMRARCTVCHLARQWPRQGREADIRRQADRILKTIPAGQRDADKYQQVVNIWADLRRSES